MNIFVFFLFFCSKNFKKYSIEHNKSNEENKNYEKYSLKTKDLSNKPTFYINTHFIEILLKNDFPN